jgi:hypothetical protein
MFKASPAHPHMFIDMPNRVLEDRGHYSTVHIPNIFWDGHLQIINCVGIVWISWVFSVHSREKNQVHRGFLITLYFTSVNKRYGLQTSTTYKVKQIRTTFVIVLDFNVWTHMSLHYRTVKWLTGWWKNKKLFEYWFILLLNFYHLWGQQTAIIYLCLCLLVGKSL